MATASLAVNATLYAKETSIMAWLEQRGNQFHLGIRLGSRKLKRSLQTADPKEAQDLADRVDRRLKRKRGNALSDPRLRFGLVSGTTLLVL